MQIGEIKPPDVWAASVDSERSAGNQSLARFDIANG
jgi:hypothetical protein